MYSGPDAAQFFFGGGKLIFKDLHVYIFAVFKFSCIIYERIVCEKLEKGEKRHFRAFLSHNTVFYLRGCMRKNFRVPKLWEGAVALCPPPLRTGLYYMPLSFYRGCLTTDLQYEAISISRNRLCIFVFPAKPKALNTEFKKNLKIRV